jgi:hypothetical protein
MANPAGSPGSTVLDIACPSAGNCYAVGTRSYKSTFAEHWNGSSWTITAMPNPGTGGFLEGVACATKTSCFAVGTPSIEHWNGHRWSLVAAPKSIAGFLRRISCPGVASCFAVGDRGTRQGATRTVIAHWNGQSWSVMTTPAPRDLIEVLTDIACQSRLSCFAVGGYSDGRDGSTYPMIYRWDGTRWSRMTPAATPGGNDESPLNGIACPSASSCVAVGATGHASSAQTMVQQWNGSSWSRVSSPSPNGARYAMLGGVACPTAATCLATGSADSHPLAEEYA